jgi:PAS domain S-box-containing protein
VTVVAQIRMIEPSPLPPPEAPARRFEDLAEALPGIVFVADGGGHASYINGRAEAYSGIPTAELLGGGWLQLMHPDDRERTASTWAEAVEAGTAFDIEYRMRRQDGAYRWFLGRALPIRDARQQVTEWFGAAVDIDDRRQAEAELARAKAVLESRIGDRSRALEEAARQLAAEMRRREQAQATLLQTQKLEALGQLTGGVAHDFNNVLAAIAGSVSLLERSGLDERQLGYLDFARRGLERAKRLVRQLVAFSRAEPLAPRPLDLATLLADNHELLAQAVGPRVTLSVEVRPDTWLAADPHQLEVALLNLAINARDAMPTGGRLTISADTAAPDEAAALPPHRGTLIAVRLRDTGAGMPPEVLARATEPFFTTKPAGHGTGLGLAMVGTFARESGGALQLHSEAGAGTEAVLYLPRSNAGARSADAVQPPIDRGLHGNATLLVIDDDELVRGTTAGILRDLGYSVLETGDVLTAYALALATPTLDAVVCDVVMPQMDGPALLARVRAERALPVLFLTGHADRARLFGELVLDKPFAPADLATHVLTLLGRAQPVPPRGSRAEMDASVQRIRRRVAHSPTQQCLESWRLLWRDDGLPGLDALARHGCEPHSFVVERGTDGAFGYRELGEDVRRALRELPDGPLPGAADVPGAHQVAAYERCLDSRLPMFERLQERLPDGTQTRFERLLLPVAASADGRPALVVGILSRETLE